MMSFTGADHRKSMDLNYFGTLNAVRAVTPKVGHMHHTLSQLDDSALTLLEW
jgi:hypothetical protein